MPDPDDSGIVPLDRILERPDGTRRTHQEAVKLYGHRAVWVAELSEALEARLSGPKPSSVPPRVFVSYRWASPEDNAWVERLVSELRSRGYSVAFDRTDCLEDLSVPEFVSRIADCHVFLAVLDPGYAERIGAGADADTIRDGWVFDEFNTAAALSNDGRLQIIGLLRKGGILPRGFRLPQPGKLGNAVEAGNAAALQTVLNQLFPPVPGLPASEVIDEVSSLVRASHCAAAEGRLSEAYALAAQAARACPEIVDGHAQLARVAVQANLAREGLEAARRALEITPDALEMLTLAAGCAYHSEELRHAVRYCVRILELDRGEPSRPYLPSAHYYLGNALDDLGQTHAGLAHLEIARRLSPDQAMIHNDTGLAYRRIDDLPRALSCFSEGLRRAPSDPNLLVNRAAAAVEAGDPAQSRSALEQLAAHHPGHPSIAYLDGALARWLAQGGPPPRLIPRLPRREPAGIAGCTKCPAQMPLASEREFLCAGCGAGRSTLGEPCPFCGSDGIVAPALAASGLAQLLCPYCRDGAVQLRQSPA